MAQQKNWIGRSTGADVNFNTTEGDVLTVYTTRCDTLFGATYMVIAPEHAYVEKWKDKLSNYDEVAEYVRVAATKSDFERTELVKEKTGVELKGVRAINPVNDQEIPIFISDYVLASYGTGAIMAVPAHDTRDWEFAKAFGLPMVRGRRRPRRRSGHLQGRLHRCAKPASCVNSGFLTGLSVEDAKAKMIEWLEANQHRLRQGQLQAPRLGFLPPALLGRAHPHRQVRKVRLCGSARRPAAPAAAGSGEL